MGKSVIVASQIPVAKLYEFIHEPTIAYVIMDRLTAGDTHKIELKGDSLRRKCKKQVFDQQFSEKLVSADFGKQLLHILIDKAVMRQRAAASLLGA